MSLTIVKTHSVPRPRRGDVARVMDWHRRRRDREWLERNPPPPMRGGSTAVGYSCLNLSFSAATGAKTALVVAAPAGHGLSLVGAEISFAGVVATDVPAVVEIGFLTLGAAGTPAGSPPAAVQVRGVATGGSAPSVTHNYTVEPTTYTIFKRWYISPNNGVLIYPLPLGREYECQSSANSLKAFGLRVNTTATVAVQCSMEVEALG